MSVIKSINKAATSKAGLKATLDYVFRESKTKPELCLVTGDYMEQSITADKILNHFWETKEIWGKTNSRQCKHFTIAWHKDSPITNEQALEIIKDWAEHIFPDFCCAIAIHTDREYVHGHIVVNSVSFLDGHKYHMSKRHLQQAKDYCDQLNLKYGLSIVEKGKHFDGTSIEPGTIRSYTGDDYKAMNTFSEPNEKRYLAALLLEAMGTCDSRESFFSFMAAHEFKVHWTDNRKYITFESMKSGTKYRDKNLSQSFTLNFGKETFDAAFTGVRRIQEEQSAIAATESKDIQLLEEEIRREPGYKFAVGTGESESSNSELELAGAKEQIRRTDNFIERFARKLRELIKGRSGGSCKPEESNTGARSPASRRRIDFRALWARLKSTSELDEDSESRFAADQLADIHYSLIHCYYFMLHDLQEIKNGYEHYREPYLQECKYIYDYMKKYIELVNSVPIEELKQTLDYQRKYEGYYTRKLEDNLSLSTGKYGVDSDLKEQATKLADDAVKKPLSVIADMEKRNPKLAEPEPDIRIRKRVR